MKSVIAAIAIALALTAPAVAQAHKKMSFTPPPPGSPICKLNYVLAPTYGVSAAGRFDGAASVHCPSGAWGDWQQGVQVLNATGWHFVLASDGGANPGLYQFTDTYPAPLNSVWHWNVTHLCDPTRSYRTWFENDFTGIITTSDPVPGSTLCSAS